MNAREMFEELNLEQIRNDDNYIEYVRNGLGGYISILFSLKWKSIKSTYGYQARGTNYHEISIDELKAVIRQAKELGWLEEEKQETNFEHYFEYLSKRKMMDFALVDGRVVQCLGTHCRECDFNGDCIERKFKWLKQPYEKPTYKLSQFEFDLIKTFDCCKECCLLNEIECIKKLREKGYFNGIDPFTKVHDIIDNCEVIQ